MPLKAIACRCGGRVIQGECDRCKRVVHRRPDKRRPSAAARGYDRTWRRVRLAKLRKDPFCQPCRAKGFYQAAVDVHHKRKFAQKGVVDKQLRDDQGNLLSVCKRCHAKFTSRGL